MMTVYASDQSLFHLALERETPDPDAAQSDRDAITELVFAMDALATGWLTPLAVGFQATVRDPASYYADVGRPAYPHYSLRQRGVPSEVYLDPAFADSRVDEADHIDRDVILSAVTRALDQQAPPGQLISMAELWWTAVRARSPFVEPCTLDVGGHPNSPVYQQIDGALWYLGPSGIAGPPARIRAENTHFTTRIELSVFWDLWIGIAPGRALLDAAIERVLARPGWQCAP